MAGGRSAPASSPHSAGDTGLPSALKLLSGFSPQVKVVSGRACEEGEDGRPQTASARCGRAWYILDPSCASLCLLQIKTKQRLHSVASLSGKIFRTYLRFFFTDAGDAVGVRRGPGCLWRLHKQPG